MLHHLKVKFVSPSSVHHRATRHGRARRRGWRACLLLATAGVLVCWLASVLAAPGDLDPSFDGDGKVITDFSNTRNLSQAVAIQPDGKIVAAGFADNIQTADFALIRYNPDGSLDTSFDGDGRVLTQMSSGDDSVSDVAIQADGKIVAAGNQNNGGNSFLFALARYNPDGSLDTSFDGDGKVTVSFGTGSDQISAVAIQPDGKIVVAGNGLTNSQFQLARFNPNGTLDSSFDGDGRATASVLGINDLPDDLVIQPDGKIVVCGTAYNGTDDEFGVARFNPDGSLDTTFDGDGRVSTQITANDDIALDVKMQPDGKIVVAGTTLGGSGGFVLVRYNPNGSLDSSFGVGGQVITTVSTQNPTAYAVLIQPNGKIIAVGDSSNGTNDDFTLVRYNSNGSLDTSFGTGGKVMTPILGNDIAKDAALQPNGKIVVAGYAFGNPTLDSVLVRYMGDPPPNLTSNFDTDRKTDIAVWNPTNHNWYMLKSTDNTTRVVFDWGNGSLGDRAVPGDYDGDGKTDIAVWRPSEGNWYVIKSSDGTILLQSWGGAGDIPVPGDYDLDGKTDTAVFRPSEGNWYVHNSRDQSVTLKQWGTASDKPVPADYDGDGATDFAVFRPEEGNWYIITSRDRFARLINWGTVGDRPVQADYDGDGRADVAVFRPSTGTWYIRYWTNTVTVRGWGDASDVAAPADYDGDGKADIAIFRPSEANWYIIESATNTGRLVNLGQNGDVPVPSAYLPQ
jgi:uncharacterized delta-60 repeat protein